MTDIFRRLIAASVTWALCSVASAQTPPFDVQIEMPAGKETTQYGSGWPLVVSVVAAKGASTYLVEGDLGDMLIIATDPGNCADLDVGEVLPCLDSYPGTNATRVSVDQDAEARLDTIGDPQLREFLVDAAGVPQVLNFLEDGTIALTRVGPTTGGETLDGYGYGANDDLPGLVLLANHGVGAVLDQNFNAGPQARRRNLAGFLEWSTFVQSDQKERTRVVLGATVPSGLFVPLLLADEAVGVADPQGQYSMPLRYRLDGGPEQQAAASFGCAAQLHDVLGFDTAVEIRAFLVRGIAPAELSDQDGDGDVDAADARVAGLDPISNESVAWINRWEGPFGRTLVFADFDGNAVAQRRGCGDGDIGPGKIKTPPK